MISKIDIGPNDNFKNNLLSLLKDKNAIKYACIQDISSIVKYFIDHGYSKKGLLELCIENNSLNTIKLLESPESPFDKDGINSDVISEISKFTDKANLYQLNKNFYNETIHFKHLSLNKEYSLKFCEDPIFRDEVLKRVKYNRRQISLNLINSQISDVSMLHDLYKIDLTWCLNVTDVSALGNVYNLNLRNCPVTDVSALCNVNILDLSQCPITDVSDLGNVYNLDISECQYVTDVSDLGNVHTLDLSNCPVTDVSDLGNVHTLDLSNCPVTDVSALGNVHTLDLSYCPVTDISTLRNVNIIKI